MISVGINFWTTALGGALGGALKYLFNASITTATADSTTITADNSR